MQLIRCCVDRTIYDKSMVVRRDQIASDKEVAEPPGDGLFVDGHKGVLDGDWSKVLGGGDDLGFG